MQENSNCFSRDYARTERVLAGFMIELAVIDPEVARPLSLLIEAEAFADERLGLERSMLEGIIAKGDEAHGAAKAQIESFMTEVAKLMALHPDAAAYKPGSIL